MAFVSIPASSNNSKTSYSKITPLTNTTAKFNSEVAGNKKRIVDYSNTISGNGDFEKLTDINVIINCLYNFLLTPIGTYIFDNEYGSYLYKKIFDPCDEETRKDIIDEVKNRCKLFDPRINVTSCNVFYLSDKKGFNIEATILRNSDSANIKVAIREDMFNNIDGENSTK